MSINIQRCSRTVGRPRWMSNLPPFHLWKCWRDYSTLLPTFSRVA